MDETICKHSFNTKEVSCTITIPTLTPNASTAISHTQSYQRPSNKSGLNDQLYLHVNSSKMNRSLNKTTHLMKSISRRADVAASFMNVSFHRGEVRRRWFRRRPCPWKRNWRRSRGPFPSACASATAPSRTGRPGYETSPPAAATSSFLLHSLLLRGRFPLHPAADTTVSQNHVVFQTGHVKYNITNHSL